MPHPEVLVARSPMAIVALLTVVGCPAEHAEEPTEPPDRFVDLKLEEGKVGKKEAKIGRATGNKIEIKKLELDRKLAENAGIMAALDGDPENLLPSPVGTFGDTVWLSNDESMSLASAQRVLHALENDTRVRTWDVRPHELLNYFTFATVPPGAGEQFSVVASAERHGGELSLALSVRGATPPRRPLDLTVLVDRSGSMGGEKLESTKRALRLLTRQLVAGDRLDIVVFDSDVAVPLEGWVAGRDGRAVVEQVIATMATGGSTNLDLGLREAYAVASRHRDTHGRNRRVMVFTDAQLNTGEVDTALVSEIGRRFENGGIRLTGVGVGLDVNDHALDRITEKGKGVYVFLGSDAVVDRLFGPSGFPALTQTVAHDVRFGLNLPPSLGLEQFYGEEADTLAERVQPVHFSAGTSQLFLQDLALKDGTLVASDVLELEILYRDANTSEPHTHHWRSTIGELLSSDRSNVRKGRALMAWADLVQTGVRDIRLCNEAFREWESRAALVPNDRDLALVGGLVADRCEVEDNAHAG